MPILKSLTSREVLKELARAEFLVASTRTQKSRVRAELERLFRDSLPGDAEPEGLQLPDFDLDQDSDADLMEATSADLLRVDHKHRLKKVRLSRKRRERRRKLASLQDLHRDNRKPFDSTYGEESLPLVGLDAPPERTFLALREQLREFIQRAGDPELPAQLPGPKVGKAPVDLEGLAPRSARRSSGTSSWRWTSGGCAKSSTSRCSSSARPSSTTAGCTSTSLASRRAVTGSSDSTTSPTVSGRPIRRAVRRVRKSRRARTTKAGRTTKTGRKARPRRLRRPLRTAGPPPPPLLRKRRHSSRLTPGQRLGVVPATARSTQG